MLKVTGYLFSFPNNPVVISSLCIIYKQPNVSVDSLDVFLNGCTVWGWGYCLLACVPLTGTKPLLSLPSHKQIKRWFFSEFWQNFFSFIFYFLNIEKAAVWVIIGDAFKRCNGSVNTVL